jgi:hypothetical protein
VRAGASGRCTRRPAPRAVAAGKLSPRLLMGDPDWRRSPISSQVAGRRVTSRPGSRHGRRRRGHEAVTKRACPVRVSCGSPGLVRSAVPYAPHRRIRNSGRDAGGGGRRKAHGPARKGHFSRLACPSPRFRACSSTPDPSLGELWASGRPELTKRSAASDARPSLPRPATPLASGNPDCIAHSGAGSGIGGS